MSKHPEIAAIQIIADVMQPLDEAARRRISVWIWDLYGPPMMDVTGETEEFDQ